MTEDPKTTTAAEDERSLLGALLMLGERGSTGLPGLGLVASDFKSQDHVTVFLALTTLAEWKVAPDRQAVVPRLVLGHDMDQDHAEQLMGRLMARAPRQLHVGEYARRIRERRRRAAP